MKVSREAVQLLIMSMRKNVEPETVDTGAQLLTLYRLDDVVVSFTQSVPEAFYGITFEALGQDFSIINSLDLLVSGENDEGDDETFLVEDDVLLERLEEFLAWRTKTLDTFGA